MDTTLPETLIVYNWQYYMAPEVLKAFEKRHGVKVKESLLRQCLGHRPRR